MILGFGDPIASAIGHRWPIYRFFNGKSLGGSLAFLAISALMTGLFLAFFSGMPTIQWAGLAVSMVLTGTAVELFSEKLDDNFTIPVATALAGMLFLLFIS